MAARAVEIADGLVAWVNDPARVWPAPWGAGVAAERTWAVAENYPDAAAIVNLFVRPDSRPARSRIIRGAARQQHVLTLELFQRYGDGGDIPKVWFDDRAGLLEALADGIYDTLNGIGSGGLPGQPAGRLVYVEPENGVTIPSYADLLFQLDFRMFDGVIEVAFGECPG